MPDTGIKRFVLTPRDRAGIAAAAQEYDLPMQEVVGAWIALAVEEYNQRDQNIHACLASAKRSYAVKLSERMERTRATRLGANHAGLKRNHVTPSR